MKVTPTNTELAKKVRDTLCAFGGSADEIRDNLKKRGIVGIAQHTEDCPLARWMRQELDPRYEERIRVGAEEIEFDGITLFDERNHQEGDDDAIYLPEHIFEFIERVDDHHYPELLVADPDDLDEDDDEDLDEGDDEDFDDDLDEDDDDGFDDDLDEDDDEGLDDDDDCEDDD
jgi:hypothetical protein